MPSRRNFSREFGCPMIWSR